MWGDEFSLGLILSLGFKLQLVIVTHFDVFFLLLSVGAFRYFHRRPCVSLEEQHTNCPQIHRKVDRGPGTNSRLGKDVKRSVITIASEMPFFYPPKVVKTLFFSIIHTSHLIFSSEWGRSLHQIRWILGNGRYCFNYFDQMLSK